MKQEFIERPPNYINFRGQFKKPSITSRAYLSVSRCLATEPTMHSIYIRTVRPQLSFSFGTLDSFLAGQWSRQKSSCTVHSALTKWPTNQFKLVHKTRKQVLKAYCRVLYTVSCLPPPCPISTENEAMKRQVSCTHFTSFTIIRPTLEHLISILT